MIGETNDEWSIGSASQTSFRKSDKNPAFGGKWMINHTTREKAFIKDKLLRERLIIDGWCYGMKHAYKAIKP
jgi:hypothetical protein